MNSVKTVWEWSLQIEAKRLIHAAHSIADGFFRVNNFFVEPWKPDGHFSKMTVPFPDLPYHKIPRFWERAKRADIKNFPLEFPGDLIDAVVKLMAPLSLAEPTMERVKRTWEKACGEILAEIEKIFPTMRLPRDVPSGTSLAMTETSRVSQIVIHPTNFGTTCSFSVADSFPAPVEMYLRIDQDIYAITEAILSAITRREVYQELDGVWSESELLVDWLVMKSSLSPILLKYQPKSTFIPTVKYTRMKQSAQLMKESQDFYRRLGVPMFQNIFEIKDGQPTIAGRKMENVSARELEILAIMIKKNNTLVSIDELADLLFATDEEFSLMAIAKTIQRLRDKLEQNGVSGSFIQTLRGQGYVLKR